MAGEATAVVEGDIFHQSLAIEQGAMFEGRSRRANPEEHLEPGHDAKGESEKSGDAQAEEASAHPEADTAAAPEHESKAEHAADNEPSRDMTGKTAHDKPQKTAKH